MENEFSSLQRELTQQSSLPEKNVDAFGQHGHGHAIELAHSTENYFSLMHNPMNFSTQYFFSLRIIIFFHNLAQKLKYSGVPPKSIQQIKHIHKLSSKPEFDNNYDNNNNEIFFARRSINIWVFS